MNCKICKGPTSDFGRRLLLGKYQAHYRHCHGCGYLFVTDPTWLDEAYSSAIADIDLGSIERMVRYSRRAKLILHYLLDPDGDCLDYGGGYGLMVRRMRDLGYRFRWHDKFCENLFARRFEGGLDGHYELMTAFEILEHLTDPLAEIDQWGRAADNIFCSTSLIGPQPPSLETWRYYAPETGQHIGFFSADTMRWMAKRLGLHYVSDGEEIHLLSKRPVNERVFRALMNHRIGRILNVFVARPSLLWRDDLDGRDAAMARLGMPLGKPSREEAAHGQGANGPAKAFGAAQELTD